MKQICFFVTVILLSLTIPLQAKVYLCKWDQQNVTNPPRCYEITALPVGENGSLTGACCRHMILNQSNDWWWTCSDDCPQALIGDNLTPEVEIKNGALFLDGIKAAQINNLPEDVTTLNVSYSSPVSFFSMLESVPASGEVIGNQLYIEGILAATLVMESSEENEVQLQARSGDVMVKRLVFPEESYVVTEDGASLLLYPNPTNGEINLSFFTPKEEKIAIDVYDEAGKRVKHLAENLVVIKGVNQFSFNLQGLSKGNYYIAIQSNGKLISKKIILN